MFLKSAGTFWNVAGQSNNELLIILIYKSYTLPW